MSSDQHRFDYDCAGRWMHALVTELFPICRSLTGEGVRQTLNILSKHIPLTVHEIPSGTQAFDWVVPPEWTIRDAFIANLQGVRLVDFRKNNLHVVGYSEPVDAILSLAELQPHLHSLPDRPQAIPYVTSYYERQWGFCLTHKQRLELDEGPFHVVIDSGLLDGHLTYGELLIPGQVEQEVFLSTYICHPSLANNELSGPAVTTMLGRWLASEKRRYTYRLIFIPETIGALVYLSRNLPLLKQRVIAGFNVTCVGDDRAYSFLPSRQGDTLADRVALAILAEDHPGFVRYSFLDRGSDERQYCSPGIDLPVASVMRSKYGQYPEYHTSLDDLELVTEKGLAGGFGVLRHCLELLESNRSYRATCLGEPQLSRRGLYPSPTGEDANLEVKDILNVLAHADGRHDLIDMLNLGVAPRPRLLTTIARLQAAGLIE